MNCHECGKGVQEAGHLIRCNPIGTLGVFACAEHRVGTMHSLAVAKCTKTECGFAKACINIRNCDHFRGLLAALRRKT